MEQPVVSAETGLRTPIDHIRWGPIMAGLFTAISALAVLTLLGLAAGASVVDTADEARRVAIGTGVWTGLSALLSFFAGGWIAARFAALRDERHALIHGAMVWAVAVPLVLFLLTGGLGSFLDTAGAATVAQVADATNLSAAEQAGATAANGPTAADVASIADSAGKAAWGMLASLLIGLSAASFGGWLASRRIGSGHVHTIRPHVA
jgi:hypothetical protein